MLKKQVKRLASSDINNRFQVQNFDIFLGFILCYEFLVYMYMKEISTTPQVTSLRGLDGRDHFYIYFFDSRALYKDIEQCLVLKSEILGF